MDYYLVYQFAITILNVRLEEHPLLGYSSDHNILTFKIFFQAFSSVFHTRNRRSCSIPTPARSLAIAAIWPSAPHGTGPCRYAENAR